MTAREYLERLRTTDREIGAMLDYKQSILQQSINIKSMPDGVCVQTNTSSKVEMAAIRLADYGDKIDELVDSYVGMKREAECLLARLQDNRFRVILTYRYLYNWQWEKIMMQMHYESTHMFRLHGYALQDFERIYSMMGVNGSTIRDIV